MLNQMLKRYHSPNSAPKVRVLIQELDSSAASPAAAGIHVL